MPIHYNDGLDDQLAYDLTGSFVGGQVSSVRSNLLKDNQYSESENMDVDKFGSIITRRGSEIIGETVAPDQRIDGLSFFDIPSAEELLAVSNGVLYKSVGSDWSIISGYSPTAGNNVEFAQLVDEIYMTDYANNLHTYNGTDVVAAKRMQPTITEGGSEYTSATVTITGGGGTGATATATVSGGAVSILSITDQGRGYTSAPTITISESQGEEGTDATATASLIDPVKGKFLITHTNRLFVANTENYDDELAASDILDGANWPSAFKIRIGGGEGDSITGIVSWYNFNLLVFKNRSIHIVSTDPSQATGSNWQIHKVDDTVGCVANRTIVQAGTDVLFLSRDGVRTIRTILSGAQSAVSEPVSSPIDDLIERINWGYVHTSTATVWSNKYIISVPLDASTYPNYTFVFNFVTKSWTGYWTGWTPTVYSSTAFGDYPKMVFGQNDGKVLTWLDYVAENAVLATTYQDDGEDYSSMLLTRGHVFGDYMSPKLGNHADVELANSNVGCACAEIFVSLDEAAGTQDKLLASMINTQAVLVELPVDLPFTLPTLGAFERAFNLTTLGEFSEVQFRVKASSGRLTVRSIKTSAYINTMTLEK